MPKKSVKSKVKDKTKSETKNGKFYKRRVKAMWGVPCNEDTKGRLFIAKGREGAGILLSDLLDADEIIDIANALYEVREERRGCFWIYRAERVVTMQVDKPMQNKTRATYY